MEVIINSNRTTSARLSHLVLLNFDIQNVHETGNMLSDTSTYPFKFLFSYDISFTLYIEIIYIIRVYTIGLKCTKSKVNYCNLDKQSYK